MIYKIPICRVSTILALGLRFYPLLISRLVGLYDFLYIKHIHLVGKAPLYHTSELVEVGLGFLRQCPLWEQICTGCLSAALGDLISKFGFCIYLSFLLGRFGIGGLKDCREAGRIGGRQKKKRGA
jgi:hypothetical protein